MIRAEVIVKGRVQKAGYRDFIDEKAFRYTLKGYVKNLKDKTVKIECEGPKGDIERFIKDIDIQKYPIHVEDIKVEYYPDIKGFSDFEIVREKGEDAIYERLDVAAYYLREMNENLSSKIDDFSKTTSGHFNDLGSKYHTVSENLIKIAENNRQTSENLNKLVGLVETLVKERTTRK